MSGHSYEIDFLFSLVFTVIVELTVIYALLYSFHKKSIAVRDILFAGILPSVITLPYLWFVLPLFFIGHSVLYTVVGEVCVTLAEMFLLCKLLSISLKRGLIYSSLANFSSFSLGYLL